MQTSTVFMEIALWDTRDNLTVKTPRPEISIPKFIPDEAMPYLQLFYFLACGCIAWFGTFSNIINVIVFYQIRITDGMSVGLMTLSLTDLVVCSMSVLDTMLGIGDKMYPDTYWNPQAIQHAIGWWRDALFACSAWVTTFLTVNRFVCVAFPFKMKAIFTKYRSVVIMVILHIVVLSPRMPGLVTQWLEWTTVEVESANGTFTKHPRLVLRTTDNRKQLNTYTRVINNALLPISSQVLVLICGVRMIYGLNASARIRNVKSEDPEKKAEPALSFKERKLVKVVLFLVVILVCTNIPRFVAVSAKQFFNVNYGSYSNLYDLLWNIVEFAGTLNSSVNIFVYMTVNTKYQQIVKELFCRCRKDIQEDCEKNHGSI